MKIEDEGLDQVETAKHFPKAELHEKKIMIIVWLSQAVLIHYDFLNSKETITEERYCLQIK